MSKLSDLKTLKVVLSCTAVQSKNQLAVNAFLKMESKQHTIVNKIDEAECGAYGFFTDSQLDKMRDKESYFTDEAEYLFNGLYKYEQQNLVDSMSYGELYGVKTTIEKRLLKKVQNKTLVLTEKTISIAKNLGFTILYSIDSRVISLYFNDLKTCYFVYKDTANINNLDRYSLLQKFTDIEDQNSTLIVSNTNQKSLQDYLIIFRKELNLFNKLNDHSEAIALDYSIEINNHTILIDQIKKSILVNNVLTLPPLGYRYAINTPTCLLNKDGLNDRITVKNYGKFKNGAGFKVSVGGVILNVQNVFYDTVKDQSFFILTEKQINSIGRG